MKKRFTILLSAVLLLVCIFVPAKASSAADTTHVHAYDCEIAENAFLKTPATCMKKAVYYKSCECGAISPEGETFEFGELLKHKFDQESPGEVYLVSNATCTKRAVYKQSCICSTPGTETFEFGNLADHVFNKEVVAEKYRDTSVVKTCSQKEVYYKSCVCGQKSNELKFEYGDTLEHEWQKKRNTQVCVNCDAVSENEAGKFDTMIALGVFVGIILAAFLMVFLPKVIKVKRKW